MGIFKQVLFLFDRPEKDEIFERIEKDAISSKYWFYFGGFFIFVLVSFFAMLSFFIVMKKPSHPTTFWVDSQSRVISETITLAYPIQSIENVVDWSELAIQQTYAFDFHNIVSQIQDSSKYFTDNGYANFIASLNSKDVLKSVKDNQVLVSLTLKSRPFPIATGGFGDNYWWRLRAHGVLTYTATNTKSNEVMLEILITRAPTYKNPKGFAIEQFIII